MDQWKDEVNNRLKRNSLTVVLHHGSNREARPRTLSKPDMVITTYGIVSSEADTVITIIYCYTNVDFDVPLVVFSEWSSIFRQMGTYHFG